MTASRTPRSTAKTTAQAPGAELRAPDALARKGGLLADQDAPTPAAQEQLARALAPGAPREEREAAAVLLLAEAYPSALVAQLLGVARSTLWAWRAASPAFDVLWTEAVTLGVDDWHEWQLRRRIVRSDTTALIVALKKRRLFVEDKGHGPAVQVNVGQARPLAHLSIDELRELAAVLVASEAAPAALPTPTEAAAHRGGPEPGSPVPPEA